MIRQKLTIVVPTTVINLNIKLIKRNLDVHRREQRNDAPLVYVSLGVARKFDDVPSSVEGLTFPMEKPVTISGKEHKTLSVHIYNFDPTLAPEGKTVIKIQFNTDYDYWERLYKEPERYKAEKEQIADAVVALLDKRFPGLVAQVEMRDVATPMTLVRYTGNWKGRHPYVRAVVIFTL